MKIITLLRKPIEGSVAENTLKYGCGALNIEATRVPTTDPSYFKNWSREQSSNQGIASVGLGQVDLNDYTPQGGRWPANFLLSVASEFKEVPEEVFMKVEVK